MKPLFWLFILNNMFFTQDIPLVNSIEIKQDDQPSSKKKYDAYEQLRIMAIIKFVNTISE